MNKAEAAMSNLADLAKLSKELNSKSDEVNKILQDLEKKLIAMKLGVEVWIPDNPLTSVEENVEEENSDGEVTGEYRSSQDEVLGFGRIGDRYMLLVKLTLYRKEAAGTGGYQWQIDSEGTPRPLLQASRQLRIEALEHIERLIDALIAEGKRVITAIEKGRKTVDNL